MVRDRASLAFLLALTFVAAPATAAKKKKPKVAKAAVKLTIDEQEKALGPGDEKSALLRVLVAPDDPQLGPDDAPVTIVQFVDFGGAEDRGHAKLMYSLHNDYPKDVRIVLKHRPIRGANTRAAHEAALAAGEQGKFWEMHAILITNADKYDKASLERYAEALALDLTAFNAALASKLLGPRIDLDIAYAKKIGVYRAPVLFVNGYELAGTIKDADLRKRVDDEIVAVAALRKKNKKLKPVAVYAELMKTARLTRATGTSGGRVQPDPNKVYQVPVVGAPMRGDPGAKLTIVIFAEFKCPYCQRVQATLTEVEKHYKNEVRIVYRHFIVHQTARDLQRAAAAAAEQGKFWDMHDLFYVDITKNDGSKIDDYAAQLGLDATRFRDALDTKRADAVVDGDLLIGKQFGVTGTPAFYVNGRFLSGAQPLASFVKLCDVELARADALLAKGVTRANLYDELIRGGELKVGP